MTSRFFVSAILVSSVFAVAIPAKADSFNFSTGGPTNAMASASRPDSAGKTEIESADDFVTSHSDVDNKRHLYRAVSKQSRPRLCKM